MPSLPSFTQYRVLTTAVRKERDTKGIKNSKEKINLSLFDDDLSFHLKDPVESTRKLLA